MDIEDLVALGIRNVSKRGGSLSITIPPEVTQALGINDGDIVAFLLNQANGQIIFAKLPKKLTTPSGLTFSLSKDLAKKALKKDRK